MARISAFLSLVLVAVASALDAQEGDLQIEPSTRVRVWPVDAAEPIIGVLHRFDADSVAIATADATLILARDSVVRMDISRGVHTDAWRGLRTGSLVGAAVGLGIGLISWSAEKPSNIVLEVGSNWLWLGPAMGAVTGGLLGLGMGALSQSEHWSRVPMDPVAVRPLVTRRDGRMLVGLQVGR